MLDDDQSVRLGTGTLEDPTDHEGRAGRGKRRSVLEISAVAIAILLAILVVVAALDMKFEADQARWQQRQTCLQWYRLQAEYRIGPATEKLPTAAGDCGGAKGDNGDQLVPGGTERVVVPAGRPATSTTAPVATSPNTTASIATTTSTPPARPGQ